MTTDTNTYTYTKTAAAAAYAAFVGIDWADSQHAVAIQETGGGIEELWLRAAPEAVHAWAADLAVRFGGAPVAVGVELSKGALIEVLRGYAHIDIFPLNPATTKHYRKAFTPSGAKDDMPDARLQLGLVRDHREKLRPLRARGGADAEIELLSRGRRKLVELKKKLCNTLRDTLKGYYPLALEVAGELGSAMSCKFILRWPELVALKRARPATLRTFYHACGSRGAGLIGERIDKVATAGHITTDPGVLGPTSLVATALARQIKSLCDEIAKFDVRLKAAFAAHAGAGLWGSFPGAGAVFAPRLAAAWGSDRRSYAAAEDMQLYSGVAPVTVRSGDRESVRRRRSRPLFLHQTFWEYANQSYLHCGWARRFVDAQKAVGKKHSTAVRALAFKWIRIMFACWKAGEPYDDACYEEALRRKGSPLAKPAEKAA